MVHTWITHGVCKISIVFIRYGILSFFSIVGSKLFLFSHFLCRLVWGDVWFAVDCEFVWQNEISMVNLLLNVYLATLFGGFCLDCVHGCVCRDFGIMFSSSCDQICIQHCMLLSWGLFIQKLLHLLVKSILLIWASERASENYMLLCPPISIRPTCDFMCVCFSIGCNVFAINPVVIHCQRRHQ